MYCGFLQFFFFFIYMNNLIYVTKVEKGEDSVLVILGAYNKIPQTGLNNRNLFLVVVEKLQDKVPADSVPGESPLPDLQTVTFWPYPQPHKMGRRGSGLSLLIRTLIPSWGPIPIFMTSSKHNYLLKASTPKTTTLVG